jgi:hypothetical protein
VRSGTVLDPQSCLGIQKVVHMSHAMTAVTELINRPRRLQRAMKTYADRLLPGRYLAEDLASLAVHETGAGLRHLEQTMRGLTQRLVDNGITALASDSTSRLVESASRAAVGALTGPLLVGDGPGTATSMKLTAEGGVLLLDPHLNQVVRLAPELIFGRCYRARRGRFAAFMATPGYEVADGGLTLIETLEQGDSLGAVPETVRSQVVQAVLADLRQLVSSETSSHPARNAAGVPVVMAHGDLTGENLVVTSGSYKAIDLVSLGERPYWYDTISLLATVDPHGLISGGFAHELALLQQAAGASAGDAAGLVAVASPVLPPAARRRLREAAGLRARA